MAALDAVSETASLSVNFELNCAPANVGEKPS